MVIEVLPDGESVAHRAAQFIAEQARAAVAARGRFVLGLSGGDTPRLVLRHLALEGLPWPSAEIIQVDERVAPAGHPDRNVTSLRESLRTAPLRPAQIHAMPVEKADGDSQYAKLLETVAGSPPVLDLAHFGLGVDGHTASLVPGDPALDVSDRDVAWTEEYQGWRRMTLTFPMLNRSRRVLWIVTGPQKAEVLGRLRRGDRSIPAGRIRQDAALLLADRAAAGA